MTWGVSPARRRSVWLIASCAVNLILVGLILAWVSGIGGPPPRRSPTDWQRSVLSSLSPADAAIVSESIARMETRQNTNDSQLRASYPKLHAVIAAAPVDLIALQQAMEEFEQMRNERHVAIQRDFIDELTRLSPEGRTQVLAAFDAELQRWRVPPPR